MPPLLFMLLFIASDNILNQLNIRNLKYSDIEFLLSYFGTFIAFLLTAYTFAISILGNILELLNKDNHIDNREKDSSINLINCGFAEMRHGLLYFAISFCVIILFNILTQIAFVDININIFIKRYVPVVYMTIFAFSLLVMFDILLSMLNISDILLLLIRRDKINK
jgi:hypothetical protein